LAAPDHMTSHCLTANIARQSEQTLTFICWCVSPVFRDTSSASFFWCLLHTSVKSLQKYVPVVYKQQCNIGSLIKYYHYY